MKISWGTGIFLFYSFFAVSLFYQVFKSTQYDHSLVVEDYYAKDLAYQSTYEKLQNSLQLSTPLEFTYFEDLQLIELAFPKDLPNISGTILFYRASDRKEDLTIPFDVGMDNCLNIFVRTLKPGMWKIEVAWTSRSVHYLDRSIVQIPKYIPDNFITQVTK